MQSFLLAMQDPLTHVSVTFLFNILAMIVLVFGMFYNRYRDRELATAAALFNIFVFSVLSILSSVEFSLAAGFGLFAILALFTLRSEPFSKIEITYFFGSISIAVIFSVQGTSIPLALMVVGLVLASAYIIDHPKMLQSVSGAKICLDRIDPNLLSEPEAMRTELSARLGVEVLWYQVVQVDYVNEMVRVNVHFRKRA